MRKFLATFDLHYGFERRNGHRIPLHDIAAWNAVLAFARSFRPNIWILGGDILDCGTISRHNHGKPGATEGLKLIADVKEARRLVIDPIEEIVGTKGECVYITGNHEDWLEDLANELPALEGLIDLRSLLKLGPRWNIIPQGGSYRLGKLLFIHGDTIKGGEQVAKTAVVNYETSIRFGHFHTYQAYTKTAPFDYKLAKTGIAVPCLCSKTPKYGEGAPNRWLQGFLYGYTFPGGRFSDAVVILQDGKCFVNGQEYCGR
jgi:hypothetical protein